MYDNIIDDDIIILYKIILYIIILHTLGSWYHIIYYYNI